MQQRPPFIVVVAALAVVALAAQAVDPYPAHLGRLLRGRNGNGNGDGNGYVTHDFMVPMRDGVQLHTVVYLNPPDATPRSAVLIRTPYGTDNFKQDAAAFVNAGHAAVVQDFRGRYKSEGQFQCWRDAATDGYDTLAWVRGQPWSNGVAFGEGGSANGIATYLEGQLTPPLLRAQLSVVGTAQLHRTVYQGGAYRQSLIGGWLKGINESSFEHNFIENEALSPWWDPLEMTNRWSAVRWPAVHLTGWYDIFNQQQIDAFRAYQQQSGEAAARDLNFLIITPGGHCASGQVPWPNGAADPGDQYAVQLAMTLFAALANTTTEALYQVALAELRAAATNLWRVGWYVLGPVGLANAKGNYWATGADFPKPSYQSWYLASGGELQPETPQAPAGSAGYDFDPRDPVPTVGGNNLILKQCGPWDQAELERRPDVLTFTTAAFTEAVAVTGRLQAELFVSSSAVDTDFTVKLTDVYPNGTVSMLIQDGILRMRWRNNGPEPELLQPGQVYNVTVDAWSTSYVVNAGHRLRLAISSSNAPRFSVNPNDGSPLASPAPTLTVAHNVVHFGAPYPSRLLLPVVPLEAMPPADVAKAFRL